MGTTFWTSNVGSSRGRGVALVSGGPEVRPAAQVDQAAAEGEGGPYPRQPDGQARRLLRPDCHHAGPEPAHRPGRRADDDRPEPDVSRHRDALQHPEVGLKRAQTGASVEAR